MTDFITTLGIAGIDARDIDCSSIGEWQRVATTDKPRKRNGAVLVFETCPMRLFYRNFATGVEGLFSESGGFMSPTDMEQIRRAQEHARRDREHGQAKAAKEAEKVWRNATSADPRHPYLVKKQVEPHGIRQHDHKLIIPMFDTNGLIWSQQAVFEDGMKRYMRGGRKDGNYYPITSGSVGPLLVLAEGFATAATIHECTGYPVAVCFDAPNLIPVAKTLRGKYNGTHIVIAADNDVHTDGNPGLTYAGTAAAQVAGQVIYPEFGDVEQKLTDWNDMACLHGPETVTQLFEEALHDGQAIRG